MQGQTSRCALALAHTLSHIAVYFRNNWSAKIEGAFTDKLSSHTVDAGTVWKQWQTAIQWSGEVQKPWLSKTETQIHALILKLGDKTPECNGYLVRGITFRKQISRQGRLFMITTTTKTQNWLNYPDVSEHTLQRPHHTAHLQVARKMNSK